MHETVENGVGVGRITDELMPVLDGHLAGHEGGPAAIAILQDLQQILPAVGIERLEPSVIKNEQLRLRQATQQPSVSAVGSCKCEVGKKLGDTLIEHRAVIPARLVPEC